LLSGALIFYLIFRPRVFGRRRIIDNSIKVRVSIPTATRQQVYARAMGRCERPRCSYSGKLHIHHIDENPSNNSPTNLVAVCPNCHSRIHDGEFSIDAQRSWIES
jgi:5-methylcytosine-specific restriction endonuclease McrA